MQTAFSTNFVGVLAALSDLHNSFNESGAITMQRGVQMNGAISAIHSKRIRPQCLLLQHLKAGAKKLFKSVLSIPCLHTTDILCVYGSGGARCALSVCRIDAFLNTYICTVLHTPGPDVAPSTPQQETKSRAFHHSYSSKQSAEGGKPETCQVEQVRKQQFCLYGFTLILVSYLPIVDQRV